MLPGDDASGWYSGACAAWLGRRDLLHSQRPGGGSGPGKPWARRHRIKSMETMGSGRGRRDSRAWRRAGLGAIAGLLAGAAALGVGQLVAGLTGANGSPVV